MEQKSAKDVIKEFLISFFSVLIISYILFNFYTLYSVWNASKQLSQLSQQEYIRFTIYGSSSSNDGNTISASFSIVDSNGNEIAKIERSWTGNYLAVEFAETSFAGNSFLFPSGIYGRERIMQTGSQRSKKTSLEKFYDDNGQCLLLGFGSTYQDRNHLYTIARFANRKIPVLTFGRVSTYTLDLSTCKINRYYSIQHTQAGNLIVVEL